GGGALPMADIPPVVVTLAPQQISVTELESRLRLGEPAIVARINADRLLLDPRTLSLDDEPVVVAVLKAIAGA
ncbi:MAG: L-seryl-tRNA(Sec) selenium transferase, partial [Coriobacteriia bacterium]